MESSNSDQFGYLERDSLRQATRHHMAMSGGGGVVGGGNHSDRSKKLQSENEFLKDRVRSCEKGLGKFYQVQYMHACIHVGRRCVNTVRACAVSVPLTDTGHVQ